MLLRMVLSVLTHGFKNDLPVYYMCSMLVSTAVCLFWLIARLDFLRFHWNGCVSNGSDGLHLMTFQSSPKCCLHFLFHLMIRLLVT